MNSFRSAILSGRGLKVDPLVHGKDSRGAEGDDLSSVDVPRSETRTANHRDDDRHRLDSEAATVRYEGQDHQVDLINLSGGGAMIRAEFSPRLWDRIDLALAEGAEIECAVRWLRGDRIGLEFAHETKIDCDPAARDSVLLEVLRRSFPEMILPSAPEAACWSASEDDPVVNSRRAERRHPLIWSGDIIYNHGIERTRLRNISERGALVECPISYPRGAELLLDLGEAGQHFATVGWSCADKIGLTFAQPFDLKTLAKTRPDIAPTHVPSRPLDRSADEESAWAEGWKRQSVEELREDLEGFLKR
ncbi:MAG: PilZ domain-containing protein [Sphingomonas sp.]|uniref:PilZ domain-containing protein n=1 Tax=Sphingomonas sp. TaxID=28214 RepID=UPI0017E875EE|nr:PilZ domain-containing protein [Sphingomonas sp.]MBA3668248.1 PilZ domain-containing protein [Sphingomonas sp.]